MGNSPSTSHPRHDSTIDGPIGTPISRITADRVVALQSLRSYPSVTLLMNTRPARAMQPDDRATLNALELQAHRRLAAEHLPGRQPLLDQLGDMIAAAVERPTARALALFVSLVHSSRIDLPIPVVDRCVIDPTFATRDLVRALHRAPRHAALLLSADHARLLNGRGYGLEPVSSGAFPIHRRVGRRNGRKAEPLAEFFRRTDQALDAALRLRPMPLVLVAAEPTASSFRRLSRNTARLAGIVKGNHLNTPATELVDLLGPVLQDYLRARGRQALDLVEKRAAEGRVVRDINTAWLAARWERPELLAVEEDYFFPARLNPDGDTLTPADDVDHPDVIDDIVDELVEIVLSRGGWVALLPPGELPADTHLALTLRRR